MTTTLHELARTLLRVTYKASHDAAPLDLYLRDIAKWTFKENGFMKYGMVNTNSEKQTFLYPVYTVDAPKNTVFASYTKDVLAPLFDYLLNAFFYKTEETCTFLHGGMANDNCTNTIYAVNKYITQEVRTSIGDLENMSRRFEMTDQPIPHSLAMSGAPTPITGRVALGRVPEPTHFAPNSVLTVVGHTPQTAGIPTIYKMNGKFLIQLDTQYTDRVNNTSCLAIDARRGEFLLRGTVKVDDETFFYEARSNDPAIGEVCFESDTITVFCVGRIADDPEKLVLATYEHDTSQFPKGTVSVLSRTDVHRTYDKDYPQLPEEDNNKTYTHVVCGDIEASKSFLLGFLKRAHEIVNEKLPNEEMDIEEMSKELKKKGIKIVCIGDVVGDPMGIASMADEAACAKWASEHSDVRIIGNRDYNKLRLGAEVKRILKNPALENWSSLHESVKKTIAAYNSSPRHNYRSMHPSLENIKLLSIKVDNDAKSEKDFKEAVLEQKRDAMYLIHDGGVGANVSEKDPLCIYPYEFPEGDHLFTETEERDYRMGGLFTATEMRPDDTLPGLWKYMITSPETPAAAASPLEAVSATEA